MSTPQQTPLTPSRQLSKFLQPGRRERDRPRSSSGNTSTSTDGATTGSETATGGRPSSSSKMVGKKTSKLFSRSRDIDDSISAGTPLPNGTTSSATGGAINDPPVIIEPPSNAKPRSRPPRPSSASDAAHYSSGLASSSSAQPSNHGALGSGGGSVGRNLGDISSRLSGWFNQAFSSSSTDLSSPNLLAQANTSPVHTTNNGYTGNSGYSNSTPSKKIAHPLVMAAKQGKDHLDKAMRYLLDSDAQPDKSMDKIWLLGVEHPGYEPPPPPSSMPANLLPSSPPPNSNLTVKRLHRRDSTESHNKSPSSFRNPLPVSHSNASTHSLSSAVSSSSTLNGSGKAKNELTWPLDFYVDYTSCVWVTYRNAFPPIRDTSLSSLEPPISCSPTGTSLCSTSSKETVPPPSPNKPRWPWSSEKVWTSDAGWGCMLRTGQSLLANSLIHLHLSRQWRRPLQPSLSPEYATYVKILTWFLDTPSPLAPFGIHRMALAGKDLGKEVGSWFGPSTAAGAIKRLVGEWDCGLEVVVGSDGVIYASEVYAASNIKRGEPNLASNASSASKTSSGKHGKKHHAPLKWGDRPVLVLLGIRLGIDGVNPIYYNSVKALFTFPQSVGIAGGRPSSSYYFVGSQGDSLYYLDPHHTRPAVPLRIPPANLADMSFDETSFLGYEDGNSAVGSSAASQASSRLGRRRGSEAFMQGHVSTPETSESERKPNKRLSIRRASLNRMSSSHHQQQTTTPVSPSSANSHAANIPLSSSPLARSSLSTPPKANFSPPRSRSSTAIAGGGGSVPPSPTPGLNGFPQSPTSPMSASSSASMTPMPAHAMSPSSTRTTNTVESQTPLSPSTSTATATTIDPMSAYLATSYSMAELRTFHCERVRKMPISGLDPSMLLGFLCKNEADWKDFRERIADMAKTKKAIFSIQDEPPTWPDDEDELLDLESASEDMEEGEEDLESPVGVDDDEDEQEDGIEVNRRQTIEAKNKDSVPEPAEKDDSSAKDDNEKENDEDEEDEDEENEGEFNPVTPVAPSTKFVAGRHDTIVGRAKPEVAAAAAAVSKATASTSSNATPAPAPKVSDVAHERSDSHSTTTSTSQSHDRKDSHGHDGDNDEGLDDDDDLDDDDEWVDPIAPRSPAVLPSGSRHTKVISVSSNGSSAAYVESLDRVDRRRGKGDDSSPTPTATPAPAHGSSMISHHQKTRSMTRELPTIPTTVVSMSREPRARESSEGHSRDSSTRSSRRVSQIALSEAPVPFPSRTPEQRKTSSASSRSATSISAGSTPASPSSSPASQYPTHGHTHSSHSSQSHSPHTHHRQQHSGAERDATSYPFPGSTTDESGTTSSDSGPSSDAWAGDEKVGPGTRGSLVPKRERRTTVGRTAPSPTPMASAQSAKAKHGGRTTSGGVRAVWNDEDGDDF